MKPLLFRALVTTSLLQSTVLCGAQTDTWIPVPVIKAAGRLNCVAHDPEKPGSLYAGGPGGLWHWNGTAWRPASAGFYSQAVSAVAPDPYVHGQDARVYVAFSTEVHTAVRDRMGQGYGVGIYRPNQPAPLQWENGDPGHTLYGKVIYRIVISPRTSHRLYAATSGGVYAGELESAGSPWRLIGGFDNWTTDIAVDFSKPEPTIFAGAAFGSGIRSAGIWKRSGATWVRASSGIPHGTRTISLALGGQSGKSIFAKVERDESASNYGCLNGVFRSDDAATSWQRLPSDLTVHDCTDGVHTGYHNSAIAYDPSSDAVFVASQNLWRYDPRTRVWQGSDCSFGLLTDTQPHLDQHEVLLDKANPGAVLIATDGGVWRSTNLSKPKSTWIWKPLIPAPPNLQVRAIQGTRVAGTNGSSTLLLALGTQDNGTLVSRDGASWAQPLSGDSYSLAWAGGPTDRLFADGSGEMHYIDRPLSSDPRWNTLSSLGIDSVPTSESITLAKPPIALASDSGGASYCCAVIENLAHEKRKTLIRADDSGKWSHLAGWPATTSRSIEKIAIDRKSKEVYVATTDGPSSTQLTPHVFRSKDSGATWEECSQSLPAAPNEIGISVMCVASNGTVLLGLTDRRGGGLYALDNGATAWRLLKGYSAGIYSEGILDLLVDPTDEETLFLATTAGVKRGKIVSASGTTSTSIQWSQAEMPGLPSIVQVNALWMDKSSRRLYAATEGCGLYRADITH